MNRGVRLTRRGSGFLAESARFYVWDESHREVLERAALLQPVARRAPSPWVSPPRSGAGLDEDPAADAQD